MADLRKLDGERSKKHWAFVEATSIRIEKWPSWKQAASTIEVTTIVSRQGGEAPQSCICLSQGIEKG